MAKKNISVTAEDLQSVILETFLKQGADRAALREYNKHQESKGKADLTTEWNRYFQNEDHHVDNKNRRISTKKVAEKFARERAQEVCKVAGAKYKPITRGAPGMRPSTRAAAAGVDLSF